MQSPPSVLRRALPFAITATLAAVAIAAFGSDDWPLKKPAPMAGSSPPALDKLDELSCTKCHAEIAAEWATTMHALAWTDPVYQEELKSRKKAEACWGCHIPVPLHPDQLGGKPEARKDAQHFGVSCESCHLAPDGAMLGPTGADGGEGHKSKTSDTMVGAGRNQLCISCHKTTVGPVIGIAKDFEQSDLASKGATCVGCHCAPKSEVGADGSKRVVRSHEIQTPRDPAFLALAFELKARVQGGKTIVDVANKAGHRVPGLIGREIVLEARALDAAGKELAKAALTLDTNSNIRLGETLPIEIAAAAAKVRVVGKHTDPRVKDPIQFLDLELTP